MLGTVDYKVQGLELAVPTAVVQVDELYGILATVADNIRTGKFTCRLAQKAHQQVGVHFNVLVHINSF